MDAQTEIIIAIAGAVILPAVGWLLGQQFDKGKDQKTVESNELLRLQADKVIDEKISELKVKSEHASKEIYLLQLQAGNHAQQLSQHQKENTVIAETLKENTDMMHELRGTLNQIKSLFERIVSGKLIIDNPEN